MISLFLNTASNCLSIALVKDNSVLDEVYLKLDKDLSRYTLSNIDEIISKNDLTADDIDEIVCVRGPGSFTGLRVGVTIAKTFAYFKNIDLYSVSNLYVIATSINSDIIVPLIDARRGYVYAGVYDKDYNVIMEESYIKLSELNEFVLSLDRDYTYVSYDEFLDLDTVMYKPNIYNLYKNMKKQKEDSMSFVPTYLKKTEAEEKLNG